MITSFFDVHFLQSSPKAMFCTQENQFNVKDEASFSNKSFLKEAKVRTCLQILGKSVLSERVL